MKSVGGEFQRRGWVCLPYQFGSADLKALSDLGPHIGLGQRLTDMPLLASALPSGFKSELTQMGLNPVPLRAVGFNKSSDENWSLPWHQDRIIAMPRKTDNRELKNWSRKSGVWHCEPSAHVLAKIAFAYIAFDNIHADAGGLEIAEGTHKYGAIAEAEINGFVRTATTARPDMVAGQVLVVSALALHRSAPMNILGKRRALRIDFGPHAHLN